MSARFIAHVQRPQLPTEDVDCDAAHVNDLGYLALTVNTYVGAIACYAPGTWESYQLEAAPRSATRESPQPPEPVTAEWLAGQGPMTLAEYLRHLGLKSTVEPPMSFPEKQEHRPEVGDRLHIYSDVQGCLPGTVTDTAGLTVALHLDGYDRGFGLYQSVRHDEARTADGSWHWPHDDEQPADTESEPNAPAPVTVNITVEGSLLAERDLRRLIDQQMLRLGQAGIDPNRFRR